MLEALQHAGRPTGLHAIHLYFRIQSLDGKGDPTGQPSASYRYNHRIHVRQLFNQLQTDRSLSGYHPLVVERMYEGVPEFITQFQSLTVGVIVHAGYQTNVGCLDAVSTIADGIAVKEPGELTYRTCKQYLDGVVTVTEDEICAAILALIEQHKLIAEGAGAVSVAAAMFNKVPVKGCKTVCVVSGGNIDVTILSRVINRGLSKSGRIYTFCVELDDKPGQLFVVSQIAASVGANIISVYHERNDDTSNVTACWLRVQVETRNAEHVQELQLALKNAGLKLI